jgi:hypothetical protein
MADVGLNPRPVHVESVSERMALGKVLLRILRGLPVSVTPQVLQSHVLFI